MKVYGIIIILYLALPLLMLTILSFNSLEFFVLPIKDPTLNWYRSLLDNGMLHKAIKNSLYTATFVTIISLPLATMAAYAMARFNLRGMNLVYGLLMLPLISPAILLGVSTLTWFSYLQIPLSLNTVIVGQITVYLPFITLILSSGIYGINPSLIEASKDLGASNLQTFRKITLPLIRDSLVAAGFFAFILSFNDFYITAFLTGASSYTLQIFLWSSFYFGIKPDMAALSTILMIVYIIILLGISKLIDLETLFPE